MKTQELGTLTGEQLRQELWNTFQSIKNGVMTPESGNSLASQAREISRIIKTELAITIACMEQPNHHLRQFAGLPLQEKNNSTIGLIDPANNPI